MALNEAISLQYPIKLYAQPTEMTCWSAATTMLFGSNFSAGPGKASLAPNGGLNSNASNIQMFALSYNLQLYYPQCWTIEGLTDLLRRGPIALMGPIPSLHAIVIGGIQGDGTDGGTQLTIYDPWPPNVGRVYNITYKSLMNHFPMATMYLLQKR
jgi:hypothetical protein